MNEKLVIGIDFGGTKTKFGIVTESGEILGDELTLSTGSDRKGEEIAGTIIGGIETISSKLDLSIAQFEGIGIGSPGPLNLETGILIDPPNLKTLHNFPLKAKGL